MPFATTWMGIDGIMLSEISQGDKDKCHMIPLICLIKKEKRNEQNSSGLTDTDKGLVVSMGEGEGLKGHKNSQSQYNLVMETGVQHWKPSQRSSDTSCVDK